MFLDPVGESEVGGPIMEGLLSVVSKGCIDDKLSQILNDDFFCCCFFWLLLLLLLLLLQ